MITLIQSFSIIGVVSATIASSPLLSNATETEQGQFPFLAYINIINPSGPNITATGFLISNHHLLTKAELVKNATSALVKLGSHFPRETEAEQQIITVESNGIILPQSVTLDDPAILVLSKSARFTQRVQPILLPRWSEMSQNYFGLDGTVVAWTYRGGSRQRAAYKEVEIEKNKECGMFALSAVICVPARIMDVADTGAPLVLKVYYEEFRYDWVAIGLWSYISIWSKEGEFIETDVFIKLNAHLKFISENTGILIRP